MRVCYVDLSFSRHLPFYRVKVGIIPIFERLNYPSTQSMEVIRKLLYVKRKLQLIMEFRYLSMCGVEDR